MNCTVCHNDDDTRYGVCFDCATRAEEKASRRTVIQHILKGFSHVLKLNWETARIDFKWASERLTKTGDYALNGTFDREGYSWRTK